MFSRNEPSVHFQTIKLDLQANDTKTNLYYSHVKLFYGYPSVPRAPFVVVIMSCRENTRTYRFSCISELSDMSKRSRDPPQNHCTPTAGNYTRSQHVKQFIFKNSHTHA